jgi:isocitrate/isopropylmalate dehydrogenase
MLRFLGEKQAADQVERAVEAIVGAGRTVTGDLGGKASTAEFVDAVLAAM